MSKLDRIVVNIDCNIFQLVDVRNMHDEWMIVRSTLDHKNLGDGNFVVDCSAESINSFCWNGNESASGKSLYSKTQC